MRFCNGVHQGPGPFIDRCGRRRLHVNIFDKSAQQFTLPSTHFDPPTKVVENLSSPVEAELQFNYEPSPFAFWITRRSDPGSTPIFDTRLTSLPSTPIPAFRGRTSDPSLVFDGFPFVFEDRYLQVRTAARCDYAQPVVGVHHLIAHVEPSFQYQHLWIGRSRGLQWLPPGRAKWYNTDNVEQRRTRPSRREHVRSPDCQNVIMSPGAHLAYCCPAVVTARIPSTSNIAGSHPQTVSSPTASSSPGPYYLLNRLRTPPVLSLTVTTRSRP